MSGQRCRLCGSEQQLTIHHLIPRACHGNRWFRKRFARQEMLTAGLVLCRRCHSIIHDHFSEKQLGREFNSLEKLLANETVARYARWAAKQAEQRGDS